MPRQIRATAILNPSTGRRSADDLESMLRETLAGQFRLTILRTESAGDAVRFARQASRYSDLIIAVGGDGTVSEVASGILDTGAKLYIIPAGSTNVIARGLGIPGDPKKAARALAGPTEERRVDVAQVGNRVALHMIGSGFDALMMEDAPRALKRAAAWMAYVPAALRHFADRPWTFQIVVDGREISTEAKMVLVANGSFVLDPRFAVGRDIRADDGQLDVVIFSPPNLAATTSIASWLAMGLIERSQYVHQYRGKHIIIRSDPPAPVECDGDVIGTTPVEVKILPQAMPVLVPARPGPATSAPDMTSHDRGSVLEEPVTS